MVFQQQTLDLDLTVEDNLFYFAALRGLSRSQVKEMMDKYLSLLGVEGRRKDKVRILNGGHRRRLEIVRSLLHQPKLLLLDEATVGLDFSTRAMITQFLRKECQETGLSILWATHIADEISTQDKIVYLHQGKIVQQGSYQEILQGQESLTALQEKLLASGPLS